MRKMISFEEIELILKNKDINLSRLLLNVSGDSELKAIISIIILIKGYRKDGTTSRIYNKLMFASFLETIDMWKGKVDIGAYRRITTEEELVRWLKDNLVGKLITVKRHKTKISDLLLE